jgi:hypothetical protein
MSLDRVLTWEGAIIAGAPRGLVTSIAETMRLVVYFSSDAATAITGKLISPIWDPWNNLRKASDDHRP